MIGGHTVLCTRENSLRLTLETHAPGAAFKENNLTPQRHATGYSVSFAIRGLNHGELPLHAHQGS